MFKVTLFVQQCICSQNCFHMLFVTSSNGWWHDTTPQKPCSNPKLLNSTYISSSILIRLKQALLQNTKIWTILNLLIRIFKKHALIILLLYFDLENCVYHVTTKTETIRKSSTGIAIFEIILEFEKKYHIICVMCFIPKNSFMFTFS